MNDVYVVCFYEVVSGAGVDDDNIVVVGDRDVDAIADDIVGSNVQGVFHCSFSFK